MDRDAGGGCGTLILIAVIAFFAWKYFDARGPWTGWVYPDQNNLDVSIQLGEFDSFEQCQEAAIAGVRSLSSRVENLGYDEDGYPLEAPIPDYECGRRCRIEADYGLNVCAETRR